MQKYRGVFHSGHGGDDYVTVSCPDGEYDLSVVPGGRPAFEGDFVEVFTQGDIALIFSPGSGYKRKCRVAEVIERARDEITGDYVISEKTAYIVPDDYIPFRVKIKETPASPRCAAGDKIKASLTKYKSVSALRAVPLYDFGPSGTFRANFNAAVHGTPHYAPFSAAAEKQASSARPHDALNYITKRRDLRGKTVFTFSDTENCHNSYAFSISKREGDWELGLHVADIAEYIGPGTPLDTEAAARGKALFSERDGSPLFPASFRNSVCSLGSERPVLAVSALVTIDPSGNVLDTELCESVIDPVLTATASDVDALLSVADSSALMPLRRRYSAVAPSIEQLYELAAVLRAVRVAGGGVDFDICDRVFAFNTEKQVSGISIVPRSDSALMAAELLAAVGKACAEKLYYSGVGCVYSSCAERRYNAATGMPADRYFLPQADYAKPGYTARESNAVRGKAGEHWFFAGVTAELTDPDLSFEPKRHYIFNTEKFMRFFDPAERYSDLINLRAVKAYVRETPFDVTRYAPALQAEMRTYALKKRLSAMFEVSYAARNREKELKAVVVKKTVGGVVALLECGVCAFMPKCETALPEEGETVKVKVRELDYKHGRFTLAPSSVL